MSNMDGIATIIVRLPMSDSAIEIKDCKLDKNKQTRFYEVEKLHSKTLMNEEEKYQAK